MALISRAFSNLSVYGNLNSIVVASEDISELRNAFNGIRAACVLNHN